jgi:Zn-dependent protease with chaperone function
MTVELILAFVLAGAVAAPHVLPLQRVTPSSAAAVWFLALCLRAFSAAAAAFYLLIYFPQTDRFVGMADRCIDFMVPVVSLHVHVPGLVVAYAAVAAPVLALALSLAAAASALLRARLYARRLVSRLAIGDGPLGSTVLASDGIVVAVTRTGPARLLVSGAALKELDSEELAAGLQHELGHLRRSHRPILLAASLLRALARCQPGSAAAYRELCFSLERDADEYALDQTRNPLALASAICKAAAGQAYAAPLMALQGRSRVGLRLEYLMAGGRQRASDAVERGARMLAVAMLGLTLFLAASAPGIAVERGVTLPGLPSAAAWHC